MLPETVLTSAIAVLYSVNNTPGVDIYNGASKARGALAGVKYGSTDYDSKSDTLVQKEHFASNIQLVVGAATLLASFAIMNQAVSMGVSLGGLLAVMQSLCMLWPSYLEGQRFSVTSSTLVVLMVYGM